MYVCMYVCMNVCIDNFCVEVFEKTISRTEMIDHSFERKFYGPCYRLCKNEMRGLNRAWRARKILKRDFCYDYIYRSLRKSNQSIF